MTPLLKDLIHDLREKHLWPVAAVLLLAIVAVPAVLMRSPSEDPAAAPAAASGGQPADAAVVAPAGEGEVPTSTLRSFDEKNPFRQGGSSNPAAGAQPGAPTAPPAQGGLPTTPSGGSSSPLSGGGGGSSSGLPASGGSPSTPSAPSTPIAPPAQPDPVLYTYEVDVRVGRRGKERTRRGVERMEFLPGDDLPLLVFLGTTPSARSAVFLVDASLEQRGEGICKPSRDNCSLLHLRLDRDHDLHFFTDTEGRGYALRLIDINLVPVDESDEEEDKQDDEAAGSSRRSEDRPAFGDVSK